MEWVDLDTPFEAMEGGYNITVIEGGRSYLVFIPQLLFLARAAEMLRRSLSDSKSRRDEFSSIGGAEHRWLVRCFQDAVGDRTAPRKFDLFPAYEQSVNN